MTNRRLAHSSDVAWRFCLLIVTVLLMADIGHGQAPARMSKWKFQHESDVKSTEIYYELDSDRPIRLFIGGVGGQEAFAITPGDNFPIDVGTVLLAPTGEIAVLTSSAGTSGATKDPRDNGSFLVRISADRKQQTITRISPYFPMTGTFGVDGTLWTIGFIRNEENPQEFGLPVLRHYDQAGNPIDSRTLPVEVSYARFPFPWHLCVTRDRVGWFGPGYEYREFSLDGAEIGRYKAPVGSITGDVNGVSMNEAGDVFISRITTDDHGKGNIPEVSQLDRDTRTWLRVAVSGVNGWARVAGFDGSTLVTANINGKLSRFSEVK